MLRVLLQPDNYRREGDSFRVADQLLPQWNRDKEQPDKKSHRKITSEQWERVKAAVDTESLFALPDRIGCPGCVDEPIDWISVEYSDGTKKSVMCNSGGPPTDMAGKIKSALVQVASKGPTNRP